MAETDVKADDTVEAEDQGAEEPEERVKPDGAEVAFNLDEARRARAEKKHKPKGFYFGGKWFDLPREAPWAMAEALGVMNYRAAVEALLDGQAEEFFAVDPPVTGDDLRELMDQVSQFYGGRTAGESEASGSSSKKTTKRSRRPSSGSTTSS